MKCAYHPVGKYLLIERLQEYHALSVDHGKVIATGRDVSIGVAAGHAVAYTKVTSVGGDRYLVHEDDIVAVVTEMA